MCGIAGQYCPDGRAPDETLLAAMGSRLAHRGPDGAGTHVRGNAGLVHRRLAIIDLSDEGLQPMKNEDGSLWIVFNGEIYNYIELREELIAKGHRFHSHSDTEVILHAYEEWGPDCLRRFNGMWGFAILDEKKGELFCARDRFGIKPFYYTVIDGSFLFASEIKALLAHPAAGLTPDDETLGTYLAWGVLDHSGRTMFSGIRQLLPAHALKVTRGGLQEPYRYWDVQVNPALHGETPDDAVAQELRDRLTDATRVHLRSDVAVGTCLSGGIDSSTLTVLINSLIRLEAPRSVGSRQKTFSAVFSDKRFDESRYADVIIAATGVDAHKTEPSPDILWDDIGRLIYMQDEPFGSLAIYAQFCVMRLAKDHVKVVLDGQGADELLAGYLAYQGSYTRGLLRSFSWGTAISEFLGSMRHHRGFFSAVPRQLAARRSRRGLLAVSAPPLNRYGGDLSTVLTRELMATNLPALLHYEDRNAMAFSIESRVPFLDYRFVEYIASLPLDQKLRSGVTKFSLRHAIKGIVPEAIRCRMDKMGYVTPEEVWMKNELRPFVLEVLSSSSFASRKYWHADAVIQNYLAFLEGKSSYSPEIWRIVCAEMWLQMFFDNRAAIPAGPAA